ncbi:hypothetical protein E8E12_001833 [Didymella heteroderae]|uniref:Uncharacterized protein n=1 Tax=Didymella heteroderae TaxID=1769908 RepID=A0A9P4WMU0_9PLEO|nr:hypothetical protein E8E12_001833 [Didymella heteroderae]
MYYTIPFLACQAILGLLAPTVNAAPHDLMVNNEFVRDVGVVYPSNNFTGSPLYLVTHKKFPRCETGISTVTIASAQICVPSTCVLYKNKDCTLSEVGNDHFLRGPVDVENFLVVTNKTCGSYMCGPVNEMAHIIGNAAFASVSVNSEGGYSEGGYWGVVGRA